MPPKPRKKSANKGWPTYDKYSKRYQQQIDAATDADAAGNRAAKSESSQLDALGSTKEAKAGMVDIPGPLLVRIIRHYSGRGRRMDDDNFIGGCKELRDAIAAALCRKGDSEEDGLRWQYLQDKAEVTETIIEIWRDEE